MGEWAAAVVVAAQAHDLSLSDEWTLGERDRWRMGVITFDRW